MYVYSTFSSSCAYNHVHTCTVLWAIAISYEYAQRDDMNIGAFIAVEVLVAVMMPIFVFVGAIPLSIVLDYITVGQLDLRLIIPRFFQDVKFVSGEKNDYWVVNNAIYYPLDKKEDRVKHGCSYSIDTSSATWLLTVIMCTGIHLGISTFMDQTLVRQVTVQGCNSPLIDRTFDCFAAGSLRFVDCVNDTTDGGLHCLKFLNFGVEANFVTAISASYFIFLLTMAVFSQTFFIIKTLLHVKPSQLWGVGFILIGSISVICSITITILWFIGSASRLTAQLQQINVINIAQLFMASTFIIAVGLFLLIGKWYERVQTKVHADPVKIPLVSYINTERVLIREIEARDSWPILAIN